MRTPKWTAEWPLSMFQVSERMLSEPLKELEEAGVVERRVLSGSPLGVEYRLTRKGEALGRVLRGLERWADEWVEPPAGAPRRP